MLAALASVDWALVLEVSFAAMRLGFSGREVKRPSVGVGVGCEHDL